MIPTIYILALDQTSASSVAGPIDIFHTTNLIIKNIAGKDAGQLKWKIVGLRGGEICSASGMKFKSDMLLDQVTEPGWLFIPGIIIENETKMQAYLEMNQELAVKLKNFFDLGFGIAANCTGTFLLAESGILDGKSATTTWWLEDLFQKRYPRIDLDVDSLIIKHDKVMCSGAATAHMELSLSLVEKLVGGKYAHLCSKYLLMENRHKSQAPYRRLTNLNKDPFIQSANRYLLEHLHEELRMEDVASALAVSNRTLIRRFKQSIGDSPIQYVQKLRIERSKYLLETSSLPTGEVMERVGYQDDSTFRRIFKRYTGLTPGQYRHKFSMDQR